MSSSSLNNIKLCCYCGVRDVSTKDHIPPKAIFSKPRPSDLITVLCCFECNNEAYKHDEKFKTYLGMHIARQGGEAERLFKEGVLSTAKHNKGFRNVIFKSMYPVYTATGSGHITGKAMVVPWDCIFTRPLITIFRFRLTISFIEAQLLLGSSRSGIR